MVRLLELVACCALAALTVGVLPASAAVMDPTVKFLDQDLETLLRSVLGNPAEPMTLEQLQELDPGITLSDQESRILVSWSDGRTQGLHFQRLSIFLLGEDANKLAPLVALPGLKRLSLAMAPSIDLATIAQLDQLEELQITTVPLENLEFLSSLHHLTGLALVDCGVADLGPLSALSELEYLTVMDDGLVCDLRPLVDMGKLESLWLAGQNVSDLSPLRGLVRLQLLGLEDNGVQDISPIAGLANLQRLWLTRNRVQDLSPLEALTSLGELRVDENPVSTLSPLASLAQLTSLWVGSCSSLDLSPLCGLKALRDLSVYEADVMVLAPLFAHPSLARIDLYLPDPGTRWKLESVLLVRAGNDVGGLLAAATPDYALLQPGVYEVNLMLTSSITMYGAGTEPSDVIFRPVDPSQPTIAVYGESSIVRMSGITVTGPDRPYTSLDLDADAGGRGICVYVGSAIVQNCRITDNLVGLECESGRLAVYDTVVGRSILVGASCVGASATFRRCVFEENGVVGLRAGGDCAVNLYDCVFERNSHISVLSVDGALRMVNCDVANTRGFPDLTAFLADPRLALPGNWGLGSFDVISGVAMGVVGRGSDMTIENSRISDTDGVGLYWSPDSKGYEAALSVVVENCDVQRNIGSGIAFLGSAAEAAFQVKGTRVSNNTGNGVTLIGCLRGSIEQCEMVLNVGRAGLRILVSPSIADVADFSDSLEVPLGGGYGVAAYSVDADGVLGDPDVGCLSQTVITGTRFGNETGGGSNRLGAVYPAGLGGLAGDVDAKGTSLQPFADRNLERAVRDALELAADAPLEDSALLALTMLDARGYGILSVEGIEHCRNLETLVLWENEVSDLSPLSGLANLVYLDLDSNRVSDLTPLSSLQSIEILYLSYNPVQDVSPLSSLPKLSSLYLNADPQVKLAQVAKLEQIEELSLGENGLIDISALATMTNLRLLALYGNGIVDISPLRNLNNLTYLDLAGNAIVDAAPLAALPTLAELYLSWNQVRDLSPLALLPQLKTLALAGNGVKDIGPMAALAGAGLCQLDLSQNAVSDISPLAGFVMGSCEGGAWLDLSFNQIADLSPLGDLQGATGDTVDVRGNALDLSGSSAQAEILVSLRGKGITVLDLAPLDVGASAPPFALAQLGGGAVVASDTLEGTVVVLDFWASWCGPCRDSMPALDRLVASFGDDVVLVGVALDRRETAALEYLEANPMPHMLAVQGSYEEAVAISQAYGDMLTNGIPHTFVIDRQGIIRYSGHPSGLTADFLAQIVGE
jgi:Leucine-rich repeat (LRR) protein/thiol-disulfide isomerase/thioredoxin